MRWLGKHKKAVSLYFHCGPSKNSGGVYWYKTTGNIWKAQKYIIVGDIVSVNIVNIDKTR